MAFEDSLFVGDGSATAQLARNLVAAPQPDNGQPFSSDPVELTPRPLKFKVVDFDKAIEKPKKEKAPDLSSFGEEPPKPSSDDLSSFGEEVKTEQPPSTPGVLATAGNQATAFGKGLARGAPEAVGSMAQGAAALTKAQPVSPEGMALIDELGNSGSITAGERAKLMVRALRTIGDRGLQMDFNAALQRIARGGDAAAEAQTIRDKFGIQNQKAAVPVEETPIYKAGKDLKEWVDKAVPMTQAEQESVGGRVGAGISSMAPYLAAGVVAGPEVGMVLGATGMGAQTAGDTFQAAKAKGATDDQAASAAGWSGAIGAALGTLPLGSVFAPVSQAAPGMKAYLAAKLVQAARSGVVFTGVGEAQEYLLQQVAKEQYDPQAGYSPEAKRVISGLLTGGILGAMHPLSPKSSDVSSPEAIQDFLRRASTAAAGSDRTPEEEPAFQRGQQTRSEIDEFLRQKDQQEAAARPAIPGPEAPEPESPTPTEPEATQFPTGGEAVPSTEQTEIEGLKQRTEFAAAPKLQGIEQPTEPRKDKPLSGQDRSEEGAQSDLSAQAQVAAPRLTADANRLSDNIEQHLRQIVTHVAGPGVKIEFSHGLMTLGRNSPGYAPDTSRQAAGTYTLGQDLIRLALRPGNADQMSTAAFHEAYHHVEARLQSERERKLMHAETPRLREWIKGKTGLTDKQVDSLAGYEVRAIAFQNYAMESGTRQAQPGPSIHIMVRRWFGRLMEGLRALANGLRGFGFKTYADIFNDAYTGRFGEREPSESVNISPSDLAASWDIFRRRQDDAVNQRLRDVMNATTAVDRIKEKVQDLNEGVRRLENAVQARMEGELPDSKAFHRKKRLFPGKVATEVQDFNKNHLDPLVDLLKAKGLTFDQVGDILYAQHAPERNAYIDTINPDNGGMGSGLSNDEANAILDRYSAHDLAEISTKVDGIRDFITDLMVRSGLESRDTTDAWRAQYQHYAPLGGVAEPREDDVDDIFRESGKFNVRGREVKQALGRRSKADNPLVNLIDQAYRTIERAKKNEYLRSLYLALSGVDHEDREGFVMFDRGKPRREIDPHTGFVRTIDDSSYRFSPNAVAYKVGGRTRYMVFEKQATAEVLKRMHPDAFKGVGLALLKIENKLKAMWTHYSPEFLIRHFLFRYPIEGTLNSFEQGNVPRYMADSVPFMGRASRAIFASNKGVVHPDTETAQYQRYWTEMREAGGAMAFRQARDIDLLREHLQKKLASLSSNPLATMKDKWRATVEAMDVITNALDNSLRLAAYAEARRQGKTSEQAAVIARDATVDFQQAGAWKNWIGLWFPFGNVAIQTGARMASAVSRSKVMRRVFAGTIAAGFMSGMFNYLIGGDDKDGIPFYDKLPEWEKHLNVNILNPFHHDDKGRPIPIHIPLPYNWAFPFALGQAIATMAFSKTRGAVRKMISMATMAGVEAFTPFAQEGNLAATLVPELTRPLVHTYTNQNWTGYPVHLNPDFQKGPRSESGFKSTGEGWKYSARMLNAMSGGDRRHAGYIDMFPEDLRELFDYYSGTGTQRRFLSNVETTAENAAAGKPVDTSKLPLARVFAGTDYDASDRFRRNENRRQAKRPWER